jgi:hypothetical protein
MEVGPLYRSLGSRDAKELGKTMKESCLAGRVGADERGDSGRQSDCGWLRAKAAEAREGYFFEAHVACSFPGPRRLLHELLVGKRTGRFSSSLPRFEDDRIGSADARSCNCRPSFEEHSWALATPHPGRWLSMPKQRSGNQTRRRLLAPPGIAPSEAYNMCATRKLRGRPW